MGDILSSADILSLNPCAFFYNLYACAANRFIDPDYLGGAYLFSRSSSLAVVGSSKSGAMHGFTYFYEPIGRGATLGDAFREWFTIWGITDQTWHYGMNLLGDPTLRRPPTMIPR